MNPELRRNLWLDATPRKLVIAAAILAGVFVAVWLVDRGRHASAITTAGAVVFVLSALVWAPRAARASVTGEVRAGSWDFQRLCALAPAEMTLGKLAGVTARPWAMAAGGLLIAELQLASTEGFGPAGFWLLVAVGLAVTLQASGLATGLIDVRRSRASGRPLSARAPGLALLILVLLSVAALVWTRAEVGTALSRLYDLGSAADTPAPAPAMSVGWYGRDWPPLGFSAVTLVAMAGWALVWSWRLMRLELQWTNTPWAWIGFLLCMALYVFGFDPAPAAADPLARRLSAVAGACALLAYIAAFADPADRVRARQFAMATTDGRAGRILSHLPLHVAPAGLAILAALPVVALRLRAGEGAEALGGLAALLFFSRDLGVIAWRRFAPRGRSGDVSVLLTLLALYLLAPAAAWLVVRGRGGALFWPDPAHPRLTLVAALVETLLAWVLAAAAIAAKPAAPVRRASAPAAPPTTPTAVPVTADISCSPSPGVPPDAGLP